MTKQKTWTAADQKAYVARRRKWLGAQIRKYREKQHRTQAYLARAVGKSVATISKIEAGQQACDSVLLAEIAAVLAFSSTNTLIDLNVKTAVTDYQRAVAKVFTRFKSDAKQSVRRRRSAA